jgi:hypothetical protein
MAPATPRLVIGDTDMPAGFVAQTVLSSTASRLVLHAPPGVIRWTLDGDSCRVDQTWLVIPEGGSPGGGGFGGAGCPWAPHLSIGARGSLGGNGADFSVIGGRVLPPDNVQICVELANGAQMTVQPHDAMWLVIVQPMRRLRGNTDHIGGTPGSRQLPHRAQGPGAPEALGDHHPHCATHR